MLVVKKSIQEYYRGERMKFSFVLSIPLFPLRRPWGWPGACPLVNLRKRWTGLRKVSEVGAVWPGAGYYPIFCVSVSSCVNGWWKDPTYQALMRIKWGNMMEWCLSGSCHFHVAFQTYKAVSQPRVCSEKTAVIQSINIYLLPTVCPGPWDVTMDKQ